MDRPFISMAANSCSSRPVRVREKGRRRKGVPLLSSHIKGSVRFLAQCAGMKAPSQFSGQTAPPDSRPLSGIRFVEAPLLFPANLRYHLLESAPWTREAAARPTACGPQGTCLGGVALDDVKASGKEAIVVISDDWPGIVRAMRERGVAAERILVCLHPAGDLWGFSELLPPEALPLAWQSDGSLSMPEERLNRHLRGVGGFRLEEGACVPPPDCYMRAFSSLVQENLPALESVMGRLSDQASRDLYRFVLTADPEALLRRYLSRVFHEVQYMDYLRYPPGAVILNGGVHAGFEIPYFLARTEGDCRLHCVDPLGFAHLDPFVAPAARQYPAQVREDTVALWDSNAAIDIALRSDGQAQTPFAGHATPGPLRSVPALSIDQFVRDRGLSRLDAIKLDLEGAEERVVHGMDETLRRHRPQLAISIYHKPEHMWTLPSILMQKLPDYRFYLGHYSYQRWECVLYGIPPHIV